MSDPPPPLEVIGSNKFSGVGVANGLERSLQLHDKDIEAIIVRMFLGTVTKPF